MDSYIHHTAAHIICQLLYEEECCYTVSRVLSIKGAQAGLSFPARAPLCSIQLPVHLAVPEDIVEQVHGFILFPDGIAYLSVVLREILICRMLLEVTSETILNFFHIESTPVYCKGR